MIVTVQLPQTAAAKLVALEQTDGSDNLVADLKTWLATLGACGTRFAAAPPVLTAAGGADLPHQIAELRAAIAILNTRIGALIGADALTLPEAERDVLLAAIAEHRLRLERREEALIVAALASGLRVQRRPDADPRALLEIVELDGIGEAV